MENTEHRKKQWKQTLVVWVILSLVICLQHRFIYLYFDDYGYASLTYGVDSYYNNGVITFGNILRFLGWQYLNWGGRILYFFLEICVLNVGLPAMRLVQSILIAGALVAGARLVAREEKKFPVALVLVWSLYFLWDLAVYRDGVFWFTASVLYVWPLCPFFAAVLLQRRYFTEGKRRDAVLGGLLFFLAAFSQEQVAVLVIIYNLTVCLYRFFTQKSRAFSEFSFLICAVLGGGIEIMAPGNFVRSADSRYADFRALSLPEKILQNLPGVVNINIGPGNRMLSVCAVVVSLLVFWQHGARRKGAACKVLAALEVLLGAAVLVGLFTLPAESTPLIALTFGWIVVFCVEAILDFLAEQNGYILGLWAGGIFSQGMMLISPTLSLRCCIPFLFVLDVVIAHFAVKYLKSRLLLYGITVVLFLLSLKNAVSIYHGYHRNAETHEINDAIMRVNCVAIEQGTQMDTITLYRLQDDSYANSMAYQSGTEFIEYWLKYYYRIPQDVKVLWTDPLH